MTKMDLKYDNEQTEDTKKPYILGIEKADTGLGLVELIHGQPVVTAERVAITHDVPLIFGGGFGVKPAPYVAYLAEAGYEAFAVSSFPGQGDSSFTTIDRESGTAVETIKKRRARRLGRLARKAEAKGYLKGDDPAIISNHQMNKARATAAAMEMLDIEEVDLIGQSVDALSMMEMARVGELKIRNMLLVYPAGLNGWNKRARVVKGIVRHALDVRRKSNNRDDLNNFENDDFGIGLRASSKRADANSAIYSNHGALLPPRREYGVGIMVGEKDPATGRAEDILKTIDRDSFDVMLITGSGHGLGYDRDRTQQAVGLLATLGEQRTEYETAYKDGLPLKRQRLQDKLLFTDDVSEDYKEMILALSDKVDAQAEATEI